MTDPYLFCPVIFGDGKAARHIAARLYGKHGYRTFLLTRGRASLLTRLLPFIRVRTLPPRLPADLTTVALLDFAAETFGSDRTPLLFLCAGNVGEDAREMFGVEQINALETSYFIMLPGDEERLFDVICRPVVGRISERGENDHEADSDRAI